MIPRLIALALLMSRLDTPRRPVADVKSASTKSIDGMLFVGVRPARHTAA